MSVPDIAWRKADTGHDTLREYQTWATIRYESARHGPQYATRVPDMGCVFLAHVIKSTGQRA
eukprot:3841893-Rhodomonas_salina.1